ncbi:hypothetical protein PG993_013432 [Apiospora rasikravindrae]|uniref:F-box domain-containing protein n=1 Tax=Apiospora rasikravindrae TaxID=990691 RepID=A0ABR1RXL7_9PEZI
MPPQAQLTCLPPELHNLVLANLSNRERKRLRLTCSRLRDKTPLHITRVFLSANERNVDVFRAIANHDVYRAQITDLIWDDAILPAHDVVQDDEDYGLQYDPDDFFERYGLTDQEASPLWFIRGCESNLDAIGGRQIDYRDHPRHYNISHKHYLDHTQRYNISLPQHRDRDRQKEEQLPFPVSYAYYQGLLIQQDRVLATQADVEALAYGLARFPALRRITVTAAAHGLLYEPLYQTPMIRAFPWGFNYPIPRGWPMGSYTISTPAEVPPWDDAHKAHWRGVSAVLHALAAHDDHGVSELVVEARGLPTGLNWRLLDDPACQEYRDLAALVRKPGFRHLDLSLLVAWEQWAYRPPFRSGHLRRLLEGAEGLEHVRLATDLNAFHHLGNSFYEEHELRLRDVCPVERWPQLRHLGLNGFRLFQSDLVAFLASLPPSVQSVDLGNLRFFGDGSYRSLLCDMRERLDWRDRPAFERPRVTIAVSREEGFCTGIERVICVEEEVGSFLYGDGPNPFGREPERFPNEIQKGFGVERDEFDPTFEKPWGVWE